MTDRKEPLVSIILPIYNGERFLSISIESCLEQTYKNWELLIIDDGSSDRSPDIARDYSQKDKRIRYYRNPENLKLPRTLNRGFSFAKGDYLTWTSDDNYYRPEAIRKMVSILEATGAGLVFTAYSAIDEAGNTMFLNRAPADYRHAIWDRNFVGDCFLYSREVYETIGGYDPDVFLCEDYDYWLRVFARFDVAYIDEDLYAYRQHGGALSQTHRKGQYEMLEKVLLKNFAQKKDADTIDRFYLYRGLNRSRALRKVPFQRYQYLPRLLCYKIWHKFHR